MIEHSRFVKIILSRLESMNSFMELSARYLPLIEKKIASVYESKIKLARFPVISESLDMVGEYCLRPGKRIRPILVIAGFLGYSKADDVPESVIDVAAAVEIFHSFLLVHDDIIDKAETRRGGKSLHQLMQERYYSETHSGSIGIDEAIIYGDIMCFHAFEIVLKAEIDPLIKTHLLSFMTETYEMTAWGQALDIYYTKPLKIDYNDSIPLSISEYKTAYYTICNPFIMGLILSGRDTAERRNAIEGFALPLGIAFQLRDDLLGVFGKIDKIGKSAESDLLEGKYTVLIQKTVEKLDADNRKIFESLFTKSREMMTEENITQLKNLIIQSGSREIVLDLVHKLVGEGSGSVNQCGAKTYIRDLLLDISDLINNVDI
jgi:geranylgeranyl diphosphate synthase, type I